MASPQNTTPSTPPPPQAPAIAKPTQLVESSGTMKKLLAANMRHIETVIPRHMTPERMINIASSAVRTTPELMSCAAATMIGAVVQASILGLEPNTPLGEAWLLPFYNKKSRQKEVQLIVGYRGKIKLAENTGNLLGLNAKAVREKDEFDFEDGLEPFVRHKYHHIPFKERGEVFGYWAGVILKSGFKKVDFARREEMIAHRDRFAMTKNDNGVFGVWLNDFDSMSLKTMIHKVLNLVPKSAEAQRAWALDTAADAGISQQFDPMIPEQFQPTPGDDLAIEAAVDPLPEPRRLGATEQSGSPQQQQKQGDLLPS